jgi:hypothetical protein
MLLGPYKFLSFRSQVRDELEAKGYVVKIMEEHPEMGTDSALDEKFERIIKKHEPVIFTAFFHKDVSDMDGVIFEIGFISGRYGAINIGDKLTFLGEKGYSWDLDKAPAYIKSSLSKITSNYYDEEREYRKASRQIHYFVANIKNKSVRKHNNTIFDIVLHIFGRTRV